MVKKGLFFIFFILIIMFSGFYIDQSHSGQTEKTAKKKFAVQVVRKADLREIINMQSLKNINKKVCGYNKYLCVPGNTLLESQAVKRDFRQLYIAVLLTESDDFKFNRGLYNKYDYGYPQINIKFWTLSKMQRLGYKINSYNQLLTNPALAIKIGEAIFWHNFIETWENNNYSSLLEYATGYHDIACVSRVYYKRLTKNYLNLKNKKFSNNLLAMDFKKYNNIN